MIYGYSWRTVVGVVVYLAVVLVPLWFLLGR